MKGLHCNYTLLRSLLKKRSTIISSIQNPHHPSIIKIHSNFLQLGIGTFLFQSILQDYMTDYGSFFEKQFRTYIQSDSPQVLQQTCSITTNISQAFLEHAGETWRNLFYLTKRSKPCRRLDLSCQHHLLSVLKNYNLEYFLSGINPSPILYTIEKTMANCIIGRIISTSFNLEVGSLCWFRCSMSTK